jgi:transcriptional regulator GlxA family with amidase domain
MDKPPLRIAIAPLDGFALMSFAAAIEPLRAANLLGRRRHFELLFATPSGAPARSSAGTLVPADVPFGRAQDVDLALVIAGGDPLHAEIDPLMRWLRRLDRQGVRLGGISGGPVVLARAGLMAGRRMTVHWEHAAALAAAFPDLLIERSLYVIDRDRITTAGGTAPLDLMHALIAEHAGSAFARRVSDWFMHTEIRASADPQQAGAGARYGLRDGKLLAAVEAMENHLADPLDLTQLALLADVSARQLNRLFMREFQASAIAFYRDLRLEKAAQLLARSALSVGAIAEATGFGGQSHFNAVFAKRYGAPPARWRRQTAKVQASIKPGDAR